jgi:cytochrome c peroxidase
MLPDPLHPAVVHFPIALAVALPLAALWALVAIRRGADATRVWSLVVAAGLLLFAFSWVAVYTGGTQEDVVERAVPEGALNAHEESGERFRVLAGLAVVLLGLGLLPGRVGRAGRAVGVVAAAGLTFAAWQTGHAGGELVYRYGAANAYTGADVALGGEDARSPERPTTVADTGMLGRFGPLPGYMAAAGVVPDRAQIDLGRKLYFDARLSSTGTVSCYTCHPLSDYGTSHRMRGTGVHGQEGPRNDPSTYNAAGQISQFWDGRAETVEDQAGGPVLNPKEMGLKSEAQLVDILRSMPGYREAFTRAFPGQKDPVTFENFRRAIGAFERGLVTPAPWDRYLEGDEGALTAAQLAGFRTFAEAGCVQCHTGTYVGGSMYQKLGLARAWPDTSDTGRYAVTRLEGDQLVFKVPSLRNVTRTWPYFNDGSVGTLPEAIRLMGRYQLGRELTDAQVSSIVEYLGALEGRLPESYIRPPALPEGPARSAPVSSAGRP